ncbi:hypothetical protein LSH36_539g01115 [Paralvinella palmiformis]|uniref:Uncharacterized protein n=1 Tax=Paralvinella palmiformis TaxID=53620 RepID=A0AAD9J7F0_9ANNE|nr:hypothetical protein LSH36_539g01115 [Paralvinella palmiformis]
MNRVRAKLRPQEPRDLQFEVILAHLSTLFIIIDQFVHYEITLQLYIIAEHFIYLHLVHRHLIFASTRQLSILVDAKRWYLDGTLIIVKVPVVQLFSIHALLRQVGAMKQVPLVLIFMSRRKKQRLQRCKF